MRVKNVLACSMILCSGFTITAPAEATPECASGVKVIKPVVLEDPGRWTYTFDLSWCADGGTIRWAEPAVTARVHSPACRWAGRIEESLTKTPGSEAWSAFDMSEFSCQDGAGKEHGVNPWVVVDFYPTGAYETSSDIAA
nr:hypothetical protein DMC63_35235 [Streptomyces sp. WAC 05977]